MSGMLRWKGLTLLVALVLAGCAPVTPVIEEGSLEQARSQIHLGGEVALQAGVAKVEITPAVGTPLAGYSKRRGKPSTGIRDSLYVRVLTLTDGEDQVVLISSDLLIFTESLAEKILHNLVEELQIPRQGIVLATTHTHSGSGAIGHGLLHQMVFGKYDSAVAEGVRARVTWAVRQALAQQEPVRWGASFAPDALTDVIENRMDSEGQVDPEAAVFLVESLEGEPKAILVNAAAHPTLMDSQDTRLSADYPGVLTQILETTYPGAVCLFFNGAAGDLRPQDAIGSNAEERVQRFGAGLAEMAIGLVNQASLTTKGDLAVWGQSFQLPPPQIRLGFLPLHPVIGRLMRPASKEMHLIALGELLLVPLPAELSAEVGRQLKEQLGRRELTPILLGYADGYLGYALTHQQYRNRSYEAQMTWYGQGFGDFLIDTIWRLSLLYEQDQSQ